MQSRQNKQQIPALRKLPFLASVQHLHAHNTHVSQVCLATSCAQVQAYQSSKEHYLCNAPVREEERRRAVGEIEAAKRKSLQTKRKSHERRNRENLQKLEQAMAERRGRIAKQEQQHMAESESRKQEYQQHHQHLLTSLHHSSNRIKLRQEAELGFSLILLQQNQQKAQAAHQRKLEQLEETQMTRQARQDLDGTAALGRSRERAAVKQESELQRIIGKYEAADQRITSLASLTEKSAESRRAELEKALEKHRKQRSRLLEEHEKAVEADVKTDLAKLQKAENARWLSHQSQHQLLQTKQRLKERTFQSNSFCLQEEAEKRASAILQRHHQSFMDLATSKVERELLRRSNLHNSFLRS